MSQLFDKIKVSSGNRSTFDLSHHQVTTSDFGFLTPICYRDMLPNDDFIIKPSVFCRLAPLAVPTYGRITCRVHHFFVPYRILYPKWDQFITQDSNNHTVPPYFTGSYLKQALNSDPAVSPSHQSAHESFRGIYSRVMSNLGLNPFAVKNAANDERFAAFPFLAYYRIWMDWFADTSIQNHEQLVQEFNTLVENGGDLMSGSLTAIRFIESKDCCYKKDYFTTAKINPQDGSASQVSVDVAGIDLNPAMVSSQQADAIKQYNGKVWSGTASGTVPSSATSVLGQFTIEALRAANSLQRYLERNNFVGTKTINRILAHFGVSPQPERLDMAEFIGGSSFPIQIGDVTSHTGHTFFNDDDNLDYSTVGLGAQAGKGVGAGQGDTVRYHAKEHGIFMSLMSILPDTGYYQGISRFWNKGVYGDALDYFHPEFENLGYQEILNKELFATGTYEGFQREGIFGYTPRFSEYKFQQDVLAGDMLTVGQDTSLHQPNGAPNDSWHLFRKFSFTQASPCALNYNFTRLHNRSNDYDRIFQFTNNAYDHFYFNIDCDVKATRDMMGFGEPSLSATNDEDGKTMNLPYGGTRL